MWNEENVKQKKMWKTFMQKNTRNWIYFVVVWGERGGRSSALEAHVGYYFLPKKQTPILGNYIQHL